MTYCMVVIAVVVGMVGGWGNLSALLAVPVQFMVYSDGKSKPA